jgi:hypothetical protein
MNDDQYLLKENDEDFHKIYCKMNDHDLLKINDKNFPYDLL